MQQNELEQMWKSLRQSMCRIIELLTYYEEIYKNGWRGQVKIGNHSYQRNAANFTFHTTEKKIFKSYFLSNNETQKNEKYACS